MARTEVTVNTGIASGLNVTDNATTGIADGHKVQNPNQNVCIIATNSDGSAHDITFQTPQTIGDEALAVAEQTVSVGAGKTYVFAGFKKSIYNQDDGMIYIDYENGEHDHFTIYPFTSPIHL